MSVRSKISPVLLAIAVALGSGAPASAAPAAAAFIPTGDVADAPVGFVEMCARDAALCLAGIADARSSRAAPAAAPRRIAFSPAGARPAWSMEPLTATATILTVAASAADDRRDDAPAAFHQEMGEDPLKLLRRINSDVNRRIRQVSDLASNGVEEHWQRPDRTGDCEDLAIEKRLQLIDAGFPATRLFFAVAYLSGYGLHTVLVARLPDGDRLLDSLSPHVLRWSEPRYAWLRVQSGHDPMLWNRIGAPRRPIETVQRAPQGGSAGAAS